MHVLSRLKGETPDSIPSPVLNEEDALQVFTLNEIRKVCIRYRLRFLESKYFKAEFPYEAIRRVNDFERRYNVTIEQFRIIAPDHAFNLENINKDPLLFAELSDGRYYLVHKWGRDLEWYKKLVSWPLQSFKTYIITLGLISLLFTFLLPSSIMHVFSFESEMYLRMWLAVHTFIGLMGMTIWYGLTFDKTFSNLNWQSKYYNY